MKSTRFNRFIHIITLLCLLSAVVLINIVRGQQAPQQHRSQQTRAAARVAPFPPRPSRGALQWANAELARMSLDEKIGQLISVGINATFLHQDSEAYRSLRRQVEENHIGGIVLFRGSVYESVHLVNRMQQHARLPLLISADLEAGAGMRFDDTVNFPWNMAVGATGNPEYARRQGEITAREARALGIQQIFAPAVDVNNNAQNPVINVRSYGEDPAQVARFAAAFIEGAQGAGVIATAKHFPGHGDTATDSHRGLPIINHERARLDQIELVPFRHSIRAGVGSIMPSHISLPQIDPTQVKALPADKIIRPVYNAEGGEVMVEQATLPATLSPVVIGKLLRGELGFDGLVVTDALDMSGLTIYFTQTEAAVRAVDAGADMLIKPADPDACMRGLRKAVQSGRLTEKRVEESARRILAAKYDLGLARQRIAPLDQIDAIVGGREALTLAQEIADHAITLVRDDAKLLPASKLPADARIFNLAITNGEDRFSITRTFVAAMRGANRQVETVILDERSSEAEVQQALEHAQGANLVVASLYGRVRSGQANSVGLPDPGVRALTALLARDAPLIGISFGNPYLLQSFPNMRTYLVAYGDMPSLQRAAARAVLGEINVTGKLPITLPSLYERGTGIQLKVLNASRMELR